MKVFPLSRKKRDQKNISRVLTGEKDSYRIRSKKTVDPGTGQTLGRGTMISKGPDTQGRKLSGFKSVPIMKDIKPGQPSVSVRSKVEPADMTEGVIKKRTTTPDFEQKYGEHKPKVEARMKAQAEGRTSYTGTNRAGRSQEELSGVRTTTIKKSVGPTTVERSKTFVPEYTPTSTPSLKVDKPAAKPKGKGFTVAIRSKAGTDKHGKGVNRKVLSIGKLNIPLSKRGTKEQVRTMQRRNKR